MDNMQNIAAILVKHISSYYPDDFLELYVSDARTLYLQRSWIRDFSPTDTTLRKVVSIVHEAASNKKRFRVVDCLKLIKSLIKSRWDIGPLPEDVIDMLFELFKQYVNHKNDEVGWAVTVFIKNQVLNDAQISWLIENWQTSEHVVNRLLLYPKQNSSIAHWAELMLTNDELLSRRTELLSLLIKDSIPSFLVDEDNNDVLWAIYKSRLDTERKIELMQQYVEINAIDTIIALSLRMGRPDLLFVALEKVKILIG